MKPCGRRQEKLTLAVTDPQIESSWQFSLRCEMELQNEWACNHTAVALWSHSRSPPTGWRRSAKLSTLASPRGFISPSHAFLYWFQICETFELPPLLHLFAVFHQWVIKARRQAGVLNGVCDYFTSPVVWFKRKNKNVGLSNVQGTFIFVRISRLNEAKVEELLSVHLLFPFLHRRDALIRFLHYRDVVPGYFLQC